MPASPGDAPYPTVDPQPRFPDIEERVLAFWADDKTFAASVEARAGGANEFVFYDGPPFANGLPHYGHLLTGFVKDAVPRYQTMLGRRVERRFGWDCHGLPAETEAEKELGVSGRGPITEYGIDRFNEYCRSAVMRYTQEWRRYVTRQARWVDFDNDYMTMDLSYMESVMWAFKKLHERGLLYEGRRVLPFCWECETPLSNSETRLDDAYRERQDQAVTVSFTLVPTPGERLPLKILVWTTTPWTLPSNLALAVGPDITYAVFEQDGVEYVVGEATASMYGRELEGATLVRTVAGRDLVGRAYQPLFPFFSDAAGAFRVLAGDFVSTDEGTGAVHIAPGFGEDDQRIGEANGIELVCPVDDRGRFTSEVPPYAGQQVFDANRAIIGDLRAAGALVRQESYLHSYPHCWRTDTPLIYRAVSSWFVDVSAIKARALALNQEITWVPPYVRDGAFGKWLENARDWSVSRNRFWGSPIPVWRSDDPAYPRVDVYGSLAALERDFGVRPTDLHRPAIDELTRPNPDDPTGRSTMRRITDVLDCWFESGSMPFAQVHYPFENREWFESHHPANFIVEYIGQAKAWFYNLHVLATALFDTPSFRTCLTHGVVLGNDGRKASKRLRNFPDPDEVFDELGADAMRWALLSSPVLRGGDLIVERKAIAEKVRSVLNPLWQAWRWFTLYANTDDVRGGWRTDAPGVLDRYILAKTRSLVEQVTAAMDAYDLSGACAAVEVYLDALNNWYIRRGRERFWRPVEGDDAADRDKRDAYDTLFTVLHTVCRLNAPLLPLLSEEIFRGLTGERSVHLTDWPAPADLPADDELVAAMDRARAVCSAASSIRKATEHPVRHPLARLTVSAPWAARLAPFVELISEEVNVKTVTLSEDVEAVADHVLRVNAAVLGPRLGADTQKVLAAARQGNWEMGPGDGEGGPGAGRSGARSGAGRSGARSGAGRSGAGEGDGDGDGQGLTVLVAGRALAADEFDLRLMPRDEQASRPLNGSDGVVTLDLALTPELVAEGVARDVVRNVQSARKDAGLDITDRIHLVIDAPEDVARAVRAHEAYVREQTLATDLVLAGPITDARRFRLGDGRAVHIGLSVTRHRKPGGARS